MVVHADDRVDTASRQEHPAKRRAAVIGGEPRRQDETESAAVARQRDRPLDEQLIPVGVTVRLRRVDAGVPREADDRRHVEPRARTVGGRALVGANHVPRRVADHRIEPGVRQARTVAIEKHLWKLELPVKEPPRVADRVGLLEVAARGP